jgi:hypothetical protein
MNTAKGAVDHPSQRKFLDFSFTAGKAPPRRRVAPQGLGRFKTRVRELTRRTNGHIPPSASKIERVRRRSGTGARAMWGSTPVPDQLTSKPENLGAAVKKGEG